MFIPYFYWTANDPIGVSSKPISKETSELIKIFKNTNLFLGKK